MNKINTTFTINLLKAFAATVVAEPDLAEVLATCGPDDFTAACLKAARERGLALDAAALARMNRPDPLGLSRFATPLAQGRFWPPAPWLPVAVDVTPSGVCVDWSWFGPKPLRESFFEQSAVRAVGTPFGQLFRYRMTLEDFIANAEIGESLTPNGFIFHMSRCGSTLVTQMIAALPGCVAISEAPPIDAMLKLTRHWPDDVAAHGLRAIIAAYGRRRAGGERRYVIKLDSWHTMALPAFQRAFPDVPWVFLYREPVEVLVSQLRQPGAQLVPSLVAPEIYGLESDGQVPGVDYATRVLARICAAAADKLPDSHGLAVNYGELPAAVETLLFPHFSIACDAAERGLLAAAARRDAKQPFATFTNDSAGKRAEGTPELRALAERHLEPVIRRLDALKPGL